MQKVSQKYLREAIFHLLRLIKDKSVFKGEGDGSVIEVYPKVIGYLRDDGQIRLEGIGVLFLAFLLQEEGTESRKVQCKHCAKQDTCAESFAEGFPSYAYGSDEAKQREAEDVLRFLRSKYPGLYIPDYKTDYNLSWVDLLVDMYAFAEFWPSVGFVQPEDDCKDFCPEGE